jgi:hypothetical protein
MEHGFICELFLNYNLSPPLWLGLEFSFNNDGDNNNNNNNNINNNVHHDKLTQKKNVHHR